MKKNVKFLWENKRVVEKYNPEDDTFTWGGKVVLLDKKFDEKKLERGKVYVASLIHLKKCIIAKNPVLAKPDFVEEEIIESTYPLVKKTRKEWRKYDDRPGRNGYWHMTSEETFEVIETPRDKELEGLIDKALSSENKCHEVLSGKPFIQVYRGGGIKVCQKRPLYFSISKENYKGTGAVEYYRFEDGYTEVEPSSIEVLSSVEIEGRVTHGYSKGRARTRTCQIKKATYESEDFKAVFEWKFEGGGRESSKIISLEGEIDILDADGKKLKKEDILNF